MNDQQFHDANMSHKSETIYPDIEGEDFNMIAQRIQQATPVPRDRFKEELKQRLFMLTAADVSSKPLQPDRLKRFSVAASLVAALLLTATATYAIGTLVQRAAQLDGGLSIDEGQSVNLSQTSNGYTLTVEWIYADTNRISIGLSGENESDQASAGGIAPSSRVRLSNPEGLEYPLLSASGTSVEQNAVGVVYSFAVPRNASLTNELSLTLTVDLYLASTNQQQVHVGVFQYDIQANPSVVQKIFNLPQTVTASGIDITLASVQVTPSLTRIETCFEVSDSEFSDWFPNLELYVGDRNLNDGTIRIDGSSGTQPDCRYTNFYVNLLDEEGTWSINIIQLIGTRMLTFEQSPTQFIPSDVFEKRIEGPWTFRLN